VCLKYVKLFMLGTLATLVLTKQRADVNVW
jgi:hypothetical protein